MGFEFPAVSQSTIHVWKKPQYTRKGMWWFTLVFGFFGLHHLLLRSPQTALLFLLANVLSFGYLYFYDLIQLSAPEVGGVGTDVLNKIGLSHPWGPLGVAQGMWIDDPKEKKIVPLPPPPPPTPRPEPSAPPLVGGSLNPPSDTANNEEGPPNPWFFFFYSLLIPLAPIALAIAGDKKNALVRLLFLTIIPFGFLLYGVAMVNDYFNLLMKPADLLLFGAKRPFPMNIVGMDKDGHSLNLTGTEDFVKCPPANNLKILLAMALPFLRIVSPDTADAIETALDTAQTVKTEVVDRSIDVANKTVAAGQQALETAQQFKGAADTLVTKVPQAIGQAQQLASNPESLIPKVKMVGGGSSQDNESSPLLQGLTLGTMAALIGGGLLLQASRSFSLFHDRTDSPPNPGRI